MDIKVISQEKPGSSYFNCKPVIQSIKNPEVASYWHQKLLDSSLLNNRFLAYSGLGRSHSSSFDNFEDIWVVQSRDEAAPICLLDAGQELMVCHYDELSFDLSTLAFFKHRFSHSKVITLHEPFASKWENVARQVGYLSHKNLTTILYSVWKEKLQLFDDSSCLIKRCSRMDRQLYKCIEGFFKDAMHKKTHKQEIMSCFQRNEFFGLYFRGKLLSILAKTRRVPDGQCISYVFTPAPYRGKSLAKFLISGVSRMILSEARTKQIFLYADIANPQSNQLYRRLGFQEICQCATFVHENSGI